MGAEGDDNNGDNSGSARVFSGKSGLPLHTWDGDSAYDYFGISVSGAGDVDGDGFADLIVGAEQDCMLGPGYARVFSGKSGLPLHTWYGDDDCDFFGWSVSGAGDVNGDGYADLIVGAEGDDNNGDNSGSATVFTVRSDVTPYGSSCAGLSAGWTGSPTLGASNFQISLAGAVSQSASLLMLGGGSLDADLAGLGATGCSLYQDLATLIPATTDGSGSIYFAAIIPNDPLLLGVTVYQQWAVFDATANPLGVTTSEGLAIWIQP